MILRRGIKFYDRHAYRMAPSIPGWHLMLVKLQNTSLFTFLITMDPGI